MIARVWRGVTSQEDRDDYFEYLSRTGVKDYRAIPGNRGVLVLRRTNDARAEFLLISLWESFDAIKRFAGADVDKAVYYAEDERFLREREPKVAHYDVLLGAVESASLNVASRRRL